MALSITAISITIIISILLYYWKPFIAKMLHTYKASLHYPGPRAYPFIGNMHLFIGTSSKVWSSITEQFNTYQSPFRVWMANRLYIWVSEPEDIKAILFNPKTLEKGHNYDQFKLWMGNGIFTAPVSIWKKNRKIIMPTFNLKILESFVPTFANKAINTAKQLSNVINKNPVDVQEYITIFTLTSICENAMGIDLALETQRQHSFLEAIHRAMDIMALKWIKPWLQVDFIFKFTNLSKELHRCLENLHDVVDNVVTKKKSDFKRRMTEEFNETPRQTNFLNLLMELSSVGDIFTDQELRDEVNTMIIAGSETSASTISFMLLMLAMHPEVQDKVYQELYNIYGPTDPEDVPVAYKDLQHLEYLDRVIKETLRMFPIGGVMFRRVTEDFKLGTRLLPKGATIMVGIYAVHHNEKYWPDPFKFDPDRFLPEKVKGRHLFSYIPFSAGPRNCVGMKYAELLLKVSAATLVRKFIFKQNEFKRVEDIELKLNVLIKAKNNIHLKIEKRH